MRRSRVLSLLLGAGGALAFAGAAQAVPLPRPAADHTITTAHFVVHYYTDPTKDNYTTETQAGDLAAIVERADAAVTSWGYPPPVDNGDGRIDVYLDTILEPGVIADAEADGAGVAPDSGAIVSSTPTQLAVYASTEKLSYEQEVTKTIAHELFHLIQYRTWIPTSQVDDWIMEGSAQWAGAKAAGYPDSLAQDTGPPELSVDCSDDLAAHQMCDPSAYNEAGYSRWPFFEYLAERYGVTFLDSVLADGDAGESATDALANAIAARGGRLADFYTDYAVALMDGGIGVPSLAETRPAAYANVLTGSLNATLPAIKVPVNHLSTRYVTFTRGDSDASAACYAARLNLTVTIPAGSGGRPTFYWDAKGSTPVALAISGNTATASLPWDTCTWGAGLGWLALPNPSTTVDAADYTVASSLSVSTTPASATVPPTQATIVGATQVNVPTADPPPAIAVLGAERLTVASSNRVVTLVVQSSGSGTLSASFDTTPLGAVALRAGNNAVRFAIPSALLARLRRATAASTTLTLLPVGAAVSDAVLRHVSVAPAKPARHVVKQKRKKKHRNA